MRRRQSDTKFRLNQLMGYQRRVFQFFSQLFWFLRCALTIHVCHLPFTYLWLHRVCMPFTCRGVTLASCCVGLYKRSRVAGLQPPQTPVQPRKRLCVCKELCVLTLLYSTEPAVCSRLCNAFTLCIYHTRIPFTDLWLLRACMPFAQLRVNPRELLRVASTNGRMQPLQTNLQVHPRDTRTLQSWQVCPRVMCTLHERFRNQTRSHKIIIVAKLDSLPMFAFFPLNVGMYSGRLSLALDGLRPVRR